MEDFLELKAALVQGAAAATSLESFVRGAKVEGANPEKAKTSLAEALQRIQAVTAKARNEEKAASECKS